MKNKNNTNNSASRKASEDEIPYNISEHLMPLLDEENIIKILKTNDFFQDQTNDIFNLVISEIIYISVAKGTIIYDNNDLSNYFFIINKGSVIIEKREKTSTKHAIINNDNQNKNNDKYKKIFKAWESFGEISFYR